MTANKLTALRTWMAAQNIDAYLVTSADAHQSEDCPDRDRSLAWLSGFTGSLGRALVFADRAILFVDGRYLVQAAKQVDPALWDIAHLHLAPPETKIANTPAPARIGYDPMLWSVNQINTMADAIAHTAHDLIPLPDDPFNSIWPDRPAAPSGPIRLMPDAVAGETSANKLTRLRAKLRNLGLDAWVMTRPDDIAWLTNTRGTDIPMHPVPLSFAIVPTDGPLIWAIDPQKHTNVTIPAGITTVTPDTFLHHLAQTAAQKKVGIDPAFAPKAIESAVTAAGGNLTQMPDPITLMKALKNETELQGYRDAHLHDGVAWTAFMAWLAASVPARFAAANPVTECEAADKILALRAAQPGFSEASFNSISAAGPNAAMCHYAPNRADNVPISPNDLYLLDSGGQYLNGTTDATRTMAFAPVPDDVRRICTAVLRGFIALCSARFPTGTFPHQLDALARAPLWGMGLDYDHGTGHGVGHNLLVHENPHRLGKIANPYPLLPGHIMTIEPGYYLEGHFGLRVENQVEVTADPDTPGYCRFTPLTLAPIPLTLFDIDSLTATEQAWLDAYHADVRARLAPLLSPDAQGWMIQQTAPCASRPAP